MQPARGTAHTVGRVVLDDMAHGCNQHNVTGVFIEMTDEQVRLAGAMLRTIVEVWPAHPNDIAPSDFTPETFSHLQVRLAAAEDHLGREVRSNQAAALVRERLEADLKRAQDDLHHAERLNDDAGLPTLARLAELEKANTTLTGMVLARNADVERLNAERDRLAADLAEALSEVRALREAFGVPDPAER